MRPVNYEQRPLLFRIKEWIETYWFMVLPYVITVSAVIVVLYFIFFVGY